MREEGPLCGVWIPRAKAPCARKLGHRKLRHSPSASLERAREYARKRNREVYAARMADPEMREQEKRAQQEKFQRRLRLVNAIKLTAGCADCSYDRHPAALDFDHLPQYEKRYTIGWIYMGSLIKLFAEIAKCEVVCANCHRIRTAQRKNGLHEQEAVA